MIQRCFLYFLLPLALLLGCKSAPPQEGTALSSSAAPHKQLILHASTTREVTYQNLPSASGLEHVAGAFYVVGDDAPYLYRLNEAYKLVQRTPLFDTTGVVGGRIPKDVKPDLESMTLLKYGRDTMLLLLGSGASPAREKGYLVNLSAKGQVRELDLSRFYTFLRQVLRLKPAGELNLEGLAMDEVYAYLLQRPLGGGPSTLLRFDANAFKDFILGRAELPAVAVYYFELPPLGQVPAAFSGAYALDGRLFFTASSEDTPNAIDDGQVQGSLLGVIDLRDLPYAVDAAKPLSVPVAQLKKQDGATYTGKAESLVVLRGERQAYKVVVVSDDDKGGSELLEVKLELQEEKP